MANNTESDSNTLDKGVFSTDGNISHLPRVSVIIPIYNVEKYLQECIDSVLGQTYTNFELILVDDGSSDGCGDICEQYARNDKRIHVIHKKNGGLSDARNVGIEKARGEFISFIDSDDYVSEFFLEILLKNAVESNANIVSIGQAEKFLDGSTEKIRLAKNSDDSSSRIVDSKVAIADLLYQKRPNGAPFNLYHRSIFTDISYPVGYLYEDMATTYRTYMKVSQICQIDSKLYAYRIRKNSIIRQVFSEKKMINIDITRTLYDDVCRYDSTLRKAAASRCFSANFHVFLQTRDEDKFYRKQLWDEILRYRKMVLLDFDKRVRLKNRIAAMLTFLGQNLTYKIVKKVTK